MNRRQALTAAPAAMLAAAVPAIAASETPVCRLFREWKPLSAWLNGSDSDAVTDAEFDRMTDVRFAIEDRMMVEPALLASDVLLKIVAFTHYGEGEMLTREHLPQVWTEAWGFRQGKFSTIL